MCAWKSVTPAHGSVASLPSVARVSGHGRLVAGSGINVFFEQWILSTWIRCNMFLNNIVFSVGTGRKSQKEKLTAAETRSPQACVSRTTADAASAPPSRSSETRSVSLASHPNPPLVNALPQVPLLCLQLLYLWLQLWRLLFSYILLSRYLGPFVIKTYL